MPDYYDAVYRQAIKQLYEEQSRPFCETDEKICKISWKVLVKEISGGEFEYHVIKKGSLVCGMNHVKQATDFIEIDVDIYKLSRSSYLQEQADNLTYLLCSAELKNFVR